MSDRIICIGLKSEDFEQVWLDEDEKKLLQEFWSYLDSHYVPPFLVGYNIREFDLPFIRTRALVHNVKAASATSFSGRVTDLIDYFRFNGYPKRFCDVAAALGIPHNSNVTGADIPRLWHARNFDAIRQHNADDLAGEWALFNRLRECGFV